MQHGEYDNNTILIALHADFFVGSISVITLPGIQHVTSSQGKQLSVIPFHSSDENVLMFYVMQLWNLSYISFEMCKIINAR